MSGVTPRDAQAHVDNGGTVERFDPYDGAWVTTRNDWRNLCHQGTPRPQWRLVPITVTIEVPKAVVVRAADCGNALSPSDWHAFRQACITATQGGADAERSDAQGVES